MCLVSTDRGGYGERFLEPLTLETSMPPLPLSSHFSPSQNVYRKMQRHLAQDPEKASNQREAERAATSYLCSKKIPKSVRRAEKLLSLSVQETPGTPSPSKLRECVHTAVATALPSYSLALLFWQRLDYAAALAQAVGTGIRARFSQTPITQYNPMQILICEGGHDELSGLEAAFREIWCDRAIDEKAAVRFAGRASLPLLEFLASDAAKGRLALESAVELLSANVKNTVGVGPDLPDPHEGDADLWACLQWTIDAGLPHPAEVNLQRLCRPALAEDAGVESTLRRRRQILDVMRPFDLEASATFMRSALGREYAQISHTLYPLFAQNIEQLVPQLLGRLTLANWSLRRR